MLRQVLSRRSGSLQLTAGNRRLVSSTPKLLGISNPIPASFLRGGTSKGIYLKRSDLPADPSEWPPIFLGIMGSPDPVYGRQLNGMGGGVSSLSKICVVGPATPEQIEQHGVDVEYTFVQVGIRDSAIDYSGNCGNLSSMIGAYALDAGIFTQPRTSTSEGPTRTTTIRCLNTNTNKVIETTFPLGNDGRANLDLPQASVAGVHGTASQIILDFSNPAGARTGKLLPTGLPLETLTVSGLPQPVQVSLVDATNPSVFVSYDELASFLPVDEYVRSGNEKVTAALEAIRQAGAIRMGLDPSAKAQPKIAMLSRPKPTDGADIVVHALSMGVLHKAVPMTLGLCLGVAAKTEGTMAWNIVQESQGRGELVRILHPGGLVEVGAEIGEDGSVKSAKVVRTGRRLMEGKVFW